MDSFNPSGQRARPTKWWRRRRRPLPQRRARRTPRRRPWLDHDVKPVDAEADKPRARVKTVVAFPLPLVWRHLGSRYATLVPAKGAGRPHPAPARRGPHVRAIRPNGARSISIASIRLLSTSSAPSRRRRRAQRPTVSPRTREGVNLFV